MRRFWHRPLGSKLILLLSLSLLVIMLVAPWQRTCQVRPSLEPLCGRVYAWEGSDFGIYALLLVIAVLVWELLPVLTPRLSMRGWPTAVVTAVLGIAIVVCVIVKMIDDNELYDPPNLQQMGLAGSLRAAGLTTSFAPITSATSVWGNSGLTSSISFSWS